jgi:putative flippase GtrA
MPDSPSSQREANLSARSLVMFLLVGGFATGVQYVITAILVLLFDVTLVYASAVGFCISTIANYFLNAKLTFRSKDSHASAFPRFIVTAIVGLAINYLVLLFLVSRAMHPVPAQLLTTVCVTVWTYIINGLWTFRDRRA